MEDPPEELEPLFDYSRVQPVCIVNLDDDDSPDAPITLSPKRRKIDDSAVEEEDKNRSSLQVVDCGEKEEDWLPPPPKVSKVVQKLGEDSTLKELRLKKQELLSFTKSAEDVLRTVEESVKREIKNFVEPALEGAADQLSKPSSERAKIVVSFQDKDGLKQFRMYMDDNFERIFKMYAEKVKVDQGSVVFTFDGDKISPTASPNDLGMEDNDIIEVHIKLR